jgi:hypothetical protein
MLGPYLKRRKSYEESIVILERWLDKCDGLRPLDMDFNSKQRIKASLKNTKGFLRLDSLELKYPLLHSVITMSISTQNESINKRMDPIRTVRTVNISKDYRDKIS